MKTIKKLASNEGDYDTHTSIVEKTCGICGYDRAIYTYAQIPGVYTIICNNPKCGNTIESG